MQICIANCPWKMAILIYIWVCKFIYVHTHWLTQCLLLLVSAHLKVTGSICQQPLVVLLSLVLVTICHSPVRKTENLLQPSSPSPVIGMEELKMKKKSAGKKCSWENWIPSITRGEDLRRVERIWTWDFSFKTRRIFSDSLEICISSVNFLSIGKASTAFAFFPYIKKFIIRFLIQTFCFIHVVGIHCPLRSSIRSQMPHSHSQMCSFTKFPEKNPQWCYHDRCMQRQFIICSSYNFIMQKLLHVRMITARMIFLLGSFFLSVIWIYCATPLWPAKCFFKMFLKL